MAAARVTTQLAVPEHAPLQPVKVEIPSAVACSVTVDTGALGSPYGKDGGFGGAIGIVANGANCAWVAGSAAGWAHLSKSSGTGSDTINVTLDSNASATEPRSTELTVAGQVVGIVVGIVNPTEQEVFIGIGFAVPIDIAGSAAGLLQY